MALQEMWKRFKWQISSLAGVFIFVGSVYGTASALDFEIDRPAWHSDLLERTSYSLEREKKHLKKDKVNVDTLIKQLKERQVPVPDWVRDKKDEIDKQLDKIDKLLEK